MRATENIRFGITLLLLLGIVSALDYTVGFSPSNIGLLLCCAALMAAHLSFPLPKIRPLCFGVYYLTAFICLQTWVSPLVGPGLKTLQPHYARSFIVDSPWIEGIRGEQKVLTDAQGFRTTHPVDYRHKPKGVFRVFAIGASTTEEIYLGNHNTWTAALEAQLSEATGQPVEVVNTGVSGLRIPHHLVMLEHIRAFEPDLAVFLLGGNDWHLHLKNPRAADSLDPFPKFKDSLLRQALTVFRGYLEAAALNHKTGMALESGDYYRNQVHYLERNPIFTFKPETVSKRFARDFEKLMDLCTTMRCLIINQPSAYQAPTDPALVPFFHMTPASEDWAASLASLDHIQDVYNTYIINEARARGIPACDAAAAMPSDKKLFYDDMHYTQAGSLLLAETVTACVLKYIPVGEPVLEQAQAP